MSDARGKGHGAGEAHGRQPSAWHWATAGLGLLLVLGAFGYLIYDAARRERVPYPIVVVTTDTVIATDAGHVVRVRARNDGGVAAAAVQVRGELHGADGVTEAHDATIGYVPPRSTREAALVFAADPRGARLVVRAVGFDIP